MGIWSYQVFANDHALDYLDRLIDGMIEEIDALFALFVDADNLAQEMRGQGDILPRLEVLRRIVSGDESATLTRSHVEAWQQAYIEAFEAVVAVDPATELIDGLYNVFATAPRYVKGRRKAIARVFAGLLAFATDYAEDEEDRPTEQSGQTWHPNIEVSLD